MAQYSSLRPTLLKLGLILCLCGMIFVIFLSDGNGLIHFSTSWRKELPLLKSEVFTNNHYRTPKAVVKFRLQENFTEVDCKDIRCIDVVMVFTRANEVAGLKQKFSTCLASILSHTVTPMKLHIITDYNSIPTAKQLLQEVSFAANADTEVFLYNVESVIEPIREIVNYMRPHFSYKPGAYYSDALFFLSIAIHKVFTLEKIIMTDIDAQFFSDIRDLHNQFEYFSNTAIIGLAWEQQPVYRHLVHEYRQQHPDTKVGSPPPDGLPGFNSGVMLLHLDRMRESQLYNAAINATTVENLTKKYKFKGHLGDQDFFSLLSFEYTELFHVLSCGWNRQLCQWWKHHGYHEVFNLYFRCKKKVNVYHGNCNTPIPDEIS